MDGMQLRNNGAMLAEEDFDTHTIAAWKVEKSQLAGMDGSVFIPRRPLIYVSTPSSWLSVHKGISFPGALQGFT
jgi:hypothetical protein